MFQSVSSSGSGRKRLPANWEMEAEMSNSPPSSPKSGCGVYEEAFTEGESLPVEKSSRQYKPKTSGVVQLSTYVRAMDSSISVGGPICRLCLMVGRHEVVTSPREQRFHVQGHLRQAAYLLSIEDRALPPIDDRLIDKCFTPRSVASVVPPEPPIVISRAIPQVTSLLPKISAASASSNMSPKSGAVFDPSISLPGNRPAVLKTMPKSEPEPVLGGTATIGKCRPLFESILQRRSMDEDAVADGNKEGGKRKRGRPPKLRKASGDSDSFDQSLPSRIEQSRRNKVLAVQQLTTIYKNPLLRTNFKLVPGGLWPIFIAYGHRYRLARVYNNGKCELRCTSDTFCRGKAVICPDEPHPYYLQVTGDHCHEPTVDKKKPSAEDAKYILQSKKNVKSPFSRKDRHK